MLFSLFTCLVNAQNVSGDFYYSYPSCDKQTEFCVNLSNGDGTYTIIVSPSNFNVEDQGGFAQVSQSSYATGPVSLLSDGSISKCLKGTMTGTGPSTFNVLIFDLDNGGALVFNQVFTSQTFNEVDGTTNSVYLSDLYGPGGPLLPPFEAGFTPQKVKISGTLIIDENYSFASNSQGHSELVLDADAKITIAAGVSFSMIASILSKAQAQIYGCGEFWDRIEIEKGAHVTFWNTRVEDGSRALYVESQNSQIYPTFIDLFGNTFINNRVSVEVEDNGTVKNEIDLFVRGNTFSKTEAAYYPFLTGMVLNDMNYIEVHTVLFNAFVKQSSFKDLANGIIANNTDLVVNAVDFDNIGHNGINVNDLSTLYLVNNNYTQGAYEMNAGTGIRAYNSDVNAQHYNFIDNYFGVRNVGVFNGQFNLGFNNIYGKLRCISVSNTNVAFGDIHENPIINKSSPFKGDAILIANSSEFGDQFNIIQNGLIEVESGNNCVRIVNSQNILLKETAIIQTNEAKKEAVVVSGGAYNHVDCNNVSGGKAGILLSGSSSSRIGCNYLAGSDYGLQVFGSCENSKIRGNNFNADNIDLVYGLSSSNGYALTGRQPQYHFEQHHGNNFNGPNNGGFDARHFDSDPNNVLESRYLVDNDINNPCSNNGNFVPANWLAAGQWMQPFPSNNGIYCCPTAGCYIPGLLLAQSPVNSTDLAIKDETLAVGVYTDAVNWTAGRHLYERLKSETTVPSELVNFVQTHDNSCIGKFYDVKSNLEAVMRYSENDKTALEAYYESKNVLQDSIQNIRLAWENANTSPEQWPLEELQIVHEEINELNKAITDIYRKRKKIIMNALPDLLSQNAGISISTTYELNEREVNDLYFNYLLSGEEELTNSEVTSLESIAFQCPLAGGDAVYRARGLLTLTDVAYTFDDDVLCNSASLLFADGKEEVENEITVNSFIEVHPNPASTVLHVAWEDRIEEGTLLLYDVNGKVVIEKPLRKQSIISLDVHNLPAGIYYGSLSPYKGKIAHFKAILAN